MFNGTKLTLNSYVGHTKMFCSHEQSLNYHASSHIYLINASCPIGYHCIIYGHQKVELKLGAVLHILI